MTTSPTSKSALLSGAAKDDAVGLNGDYTFSIADLLANDPGGAAKVDVTKQFFFGDVAPASGIPSLSDQIKYLADHHITANVVDGKFVSFDIGADATDINYFVQIGNKGTWSQAHVDVTAPPPVDTHHAGPLIAMWDFEDTAATYNSGQAVNAPTGWQNVAQWAIDNNVNNSYSGTMEVVKDDASHLISGYGTGESQWLDTAASPGNIWIQLSDNNRTTNIQHDALLSFSVSKQQFGDGSGGANGGPNSHTDPNAMVEFLWNYEVVATVKASELTDFNKFHEFHVVVHANDSMDADQLMIRSAGTDTTSQGLAIDHIVLNDWVV